MTIDWLPQHLTLFVDLGDLVKEKYPHEHEAFRFYKMDLAFKIEYLELICLRHENNKKKWEKLGRRQSRFFESIRSESLSQEELQTESEILGKQFVQYSRLLMLDIDSFFIFGNILLDRIPFLLRPLYEGIVINLDIGKNHFKNFRKHIVWFKNNRESVLDSIFYNRMVSYGKLFKEKLRDPRNKIIVHPDLDTFRSEIGLNGKLKRIRHKLETTGEMRIWTKMESKELPDISKLFKNIIEFLEFLDRYFSEKISCS